MAQEIAFVLPIPDVVGSNLLVKLNPNIFLSCQKCPQRLSVVHLLEVMCQNFKNVTKLDKSRIIRIISLVVSFSAQSAASL